MARKIDHALLDNAKANKRDEFYTQLVDIESELKYYTKHFEGKIVYCNCDDPTISNFYRYFVSNFNKLKLKKVICACYVKPDIEYPENHGYYYEYTGNEKMIPDPSDMHFFRQSGDFRSQESIQLLLQSDIVVTNPPFSLFREYVRQLIDYDKKFLIIGNVNCLTYKEIFNLFKEDKVWLGVGFGRGISGFIVPEHYKLYGTETKVNEMGQRIISPNNCLWLTNLDVSKKHEIISLSKTYHGNESQYPFYDNYHAININTSKDIPKDYEGIMGVPVTFLHKYNPEQFELVRFRKGNDDKDLSIDGKTPYFRVLIRRKIECRGANNLDLDACPPLSTMGLHYEGACLPQCLSNYSSDNTKESWSDQ